MLADKMVELEYVKNKIKSWRVTGWIIPPKQSVEFMANVENLLDVYKCPFSKDYLVVCMDESPKQLIKNTRLPIKMVKGREKRVDYEYARCGVCNIFRGLLLFKPMTHI